MTDAHLDGQIKDSEISLVEVLARSCQLCTIILIDASLFASGKLPQRIVTHLQMFFLGRTGPRAEAETDSILHEESYLPVTLDVKCNTQKVVPLYVE